MFRAAVGGEDCTHTSSQGYYRIDTYSDGAAGRYRKGGGWASNGCHGTFMIVTLRRPGLPGPGAASCCPGSRPGTGRSSYLRSVDLSGGR
jgi:hypothetical protein